MATKRPNLLFLMTDQQRFDALGVNGNPVLQTPILDHLASEGANLANYYTNCPVCVPSRATLFTGRYPHSHQARENYSLMEAGREIHLFRVLKHAGYRIGYCGKNHLVDDQEKVNFDWFDDRGSEHQTAEEAALMNQFWDWRKRESGVPPGTSEIWRAGYVHEAPPEATRTWQTAQAGIEFLQKQSPQDGPFALCLSFEDPHVPHLARAEDFARYPLEDIPLPEWEGESGLAARAHRWLIKYGAQNAAAASDEQKRKYIAIYYAMITWVDTQIGRVLSLLRERGLENDTLIVFTSDHGEFAFHHGLAKKDLVLVEDLLHVPCIFRMPGKIPPGQRPRALAEEVDLFPTILELLGVDCPIGVQGTSFAGVLTGGPDRHKEVVFGEVCPPYLYCKYPDFEAFAAENGGRGKTPFNVPGDFTKSIRDERWRYVWYGNGEEELYDRESDPGELHNCVRDPRCAAARDRLKLRLLEWAAITEDPLDANLRRDLQAAYPQWTPLSIQPGKHEQPRWKETLRMPLAMKP